MGPPGDRVRSKDVAVEKFRFPRFSMFGDSSFTVAPPSRMAIPVFASDRESIAPHSSTDHGPSAGELLFVEVFRQVAFGDRYGKVEGAGETRRR